MDLKCFLIGEYANTAEILENYDEIAYFLHDDVEHMLWKERKTLSWVAFCHSVDITRQQLFYKQHLDGIKEFLGLDVEAALRWLVSRLKNNSINFYKQKPHEADVYYDESPTYDLMDIEKIRKIDPARFELAFATLARTALLSSDFDWGDFLYLCKKYGMDPEKYELSPATTMGVESDSGFVQLRFVIDDNDEADHPPLPLKIRKIRKRKAKQRGFFDAA